jgi:inosine-uridine nucleoside N-ribohydrolase
VTLVPLDATNDVPATRGFIDRLRARPTTPPAAYVTALLAAQEDFVASGQYFFWDPFAAATMLDGRLAGFVERRLGVDLTPGPNNGALMVMNDGPAIRVAVSGDAAMFERTLLDTLGPA